MTEADDPVASCIAGRIGVGVACARLLLAGLPPEEITRRLREAAPAHADFAEIASDEGAARICALAVLLEEAGVAHDGDASPGAIGAMFDRLASRAPEASVALYSLGDPVRLADATAEITEWLGRRGLIGPDTDVLDLGCGIGRIAVRLAERCRTVQGLDVSAVMIEEARRRAAALAIRNVSFDLTSGHDLGSLGSEPRFDLVLAVDSMPYIVAADRADRHVADVRRLLRPGGACVLLNISYGPPETDRTLALGWAARHGFAPVLLDETPFAHWDGRAFILRKA